MVETEHRWLDDAAGPRLFVRVQRPARPRALALCCHGICEHSGRLAPLDAALVEAGVAVATVDLRGHGRSDDVPTPDGPGLRVHVEAFDDYLDDFARLDRHARAALGDLPVFLLGHSMGGLVVARYAALRRPPTAGLVTLSAAFALPKVTQLECGLLAPIVRFDGGRRALGGPAVNFVLDRQARQALSRDPAVFDAYVADPLVSREPTMRLVVEIWRAGRDLLARRPRLDTAALALHGTDDSITDPDGSRDWIALQEGRDATLRLFPESRHELHHDLDADEVCRTVVEWVAARAPER